MHEMPASLLPVLPSGLEGLVLPATLAAACQPLLSALSHRECLGLSGFESAGHAEQAGILRWAAQHPALQRLSLGCVFPEQATFSTAMVQAAVEARLCKPSLHLDFGRSVVAEFTHEAPPWCREE
jgi:hypothetical protein